TFPLQPKEYSLRATAANWLPAQKSWVVELYESQQLTVNFAQVPVAAAVPAPPPAGAAPAAAATEELGMRASTRGLSQLAQLKVVSADHLAPLEVTDSAGKLVKVGHGVLECDDLLPGFYVARLRPPEGAPA